MFCSTGLTSPGAPPEFKRRRAMGWVTLTLMHQASGELRMVSGSQGRIVRRVGGGVLHIGSGPTPWPQHSGASTWPECRWDLRVSSPWRDDGGGMLAGPVRP